MTPLETTIAKMAEQAAAAHGLKVVSTRFTSTGKYQTLQVLLETPEGASPTLDACTAVSKALARELDTQDTIKHRYTLEVGSPGLDRPLHTPADYQRFAGKNVSVRFNHMQHSGYNSFQNATGIIVSADATTVTLQLETAETPQSFQRSHIHSAKLAPTKAELDAWMKQATHKSTKPELNEGE